MKVLAIIPARMGSSRFPGKPMKKILGVPMIQRVFENVRKSDLIQKTVVATCDEIIFDFMKSIGCECIMTSDIHERASDRCSEALKIIESKSSERYDVILMVQGDEPLINTQMIKESLIPFYKDNKINVVNLIGQIKTKKEFEDPNCIKVVCDKFNDALFFSRQPIPTLKNPSFPFLGKQVCVIPFKRDFLTVYNQLPATKFEINESIDMLRVLEHGYKVRMIPTYEHSQAVDTFEDLQIVEKILSKKI